MEIVQAKDIFMVSRKAGWLSKRTILWYDVALIRFVDFTTENKITKIELVSRFTIMEYMNHLGEKMQAVTVAGHFRALRALFNFLFEEEYIVKNPMRNQKTPKVEQKFMRTFSKQEIEMILKSYNQLDFFGFRNYMIMCMLFSTGIRKGELLALKETSVNLTVDVMRIMGKGSKERIVPIGKVLRRVIIEYLKKREEFLNGTYCQSFLITKYKKPMAVSCLSTIFANLKKELNLTGEKFSPHTFRHTFAKTFLLNGGDVFSLQKILGHSDIATTKKYIHLNDKELKMQHAKFNPLDNKEWMI